MVDIDLMYKKNQETKTEKVSRQSRMRNEWMYITYLKSCMEWWILITMSFGRLHIMGMIIIHRLHATGFCVCADF